MNFKRAAAQALAGIVSSKIAEFDGKCFTVAADPTQKAKWPSLYVLPKSFEFMPWQEAGLWSDPYSDGTLVAVGDYVGDLELRLSAHSPLERGELEARIVDLFMQRHGAPGVLLGVIPQVSVGPTNTSYSADVSYALDSDDWREEFAFAEERYSFLTVGCVVPVMTMRHYPTVQHLVLELTGDMDTSKTPTDVEQVEVSDTGSIAPY